ncbi:ABC transporter permease subunit [Sulfurovum sp. XGS-02]|uniref:ABC transporter permease subunit n=1 Tax=Sulfurovum sp. XGS-02 TaxID=2925411 RepID=UPI002070A3DA|nr:ABC transporter permease subunit [Sulfurovum sp. XGS-02]UPT78006.1 ABC transporter permease subunit [Sulfurovum sp. XGS-02]
MASIIGTIKMLQDVKRLKHSLLPGGFISLLLLGFAFLLFFIFFLSQEDTSVIELDSRVFSLLQFTLYQAFLSTLLSLLVGLSLAWSLAHQSNFKGRSLLVALFSSSLVLPTLIVVFGLIAVLGRNGWVNQLSLYLFDQSFGAYLYGLTGILVAHVYLNASFASRSLLHVFESIPKEKYKLAKSLNFTTFQRFIYVEWPAIRTTLLSIASTIFLLCFTSFAIVLVLGGSPAYNTLEVAIYEAVKLEFDITMALKLALIQLAVTTFLVLFSSNFRTNIGNVRTGTLHIPWSESKHVKRFQVAIITLFSLFFTLPLLAIIVDGLGAEFKRILAEPLFIKSFFTSMGLATVSSILTVLFALFLSDTKRNFTLKHRLPYNTFSKVLNTIVSFSGNLYLAIPSLIMGLGFFLLSQTYEAPIAVWSTLALLTANVLMSLPFALAVLAPVMQKTGQRYDKLVFSLNLTPLQRWVYCEYPYLKSSIGYVFALSFCFSLGDLGIIALFGSDDFLTLPWYLYQLMGSYRTSDAAGVALILLAITLCVFVLLPRLFRRSVAKDN